MISVVIPVHNRERSVARSIESVLKQTHADLEAVVIDDASTDETEKSVKNFDDPRIRYERLKKNCGVHMARNRGLEISRGEFVVFFDSDDELFPQALERMHAVFTDPKWGIVTAPYRLPDGNLTSFDLPDGEVNFEAYMCNKHMRPNKASLIMYRRSVLGDLRWFERNLDFVFCRRVAAQAKQYYIAEPLAAYHTQTGGTADSMTLKRRTPNKALSISRARIIADFADDFAPMLMKSCPRLYGYYAYGAAVGLLLAAETQKSRRFAYAAARNQPRLQYVLFYIFSLMPGAGWILGLLFDAKSALMTSKT
jgi:glycosyltransferase involved in cell wall biosynthesis